MMTPLCEWSRKLQCDKGGQHLMNGGQSCEICHEYTPLYWERYKHKRGDVYNVLEMGTLNGAGLRLFARLFPMAKIWGFEYDPNYVKIGNTINHRIHVLQCNIGDFRELQLSVAKTGIPEFDVIVDDGPHDPQQQRQTAAYMLPWLTRTGTYWVEDCVGDFSAAPGLLITNHHIPRVVGTPGTDTLVEIRYENP